MNPTYPVSVLAKGSRAEAGGNESDPGFGPKHEAAGQNTVTTLTKELGTAHWPVCQTLFLQTGGF